MANKGKELLGKVRIEFADCSVMPQTCDLVCFPSGIGRWQIVLGLQLADCVGTPAPFSEQVNDRGIDVIDTVPEVAKVGNGTTRMREHSIRLLGAFGEPFDCSRLGQAAALAETASIRRVMSGSCSR
jgi:hypothetical protein